MAMVALSSDDKKRSVIERHTETDTPLWVLLCTYFSFLILILIGHTRDFFGKIFRRKQYLHLLEHDVSPYPSVAASNIYIYRCLVYVGIGAIKQ